MRRLVPALLLALAVGLASPALAQEELSPGRMVEILETIDDRQSNSGDYKALMYIEQKEKGDSDLLYEAVVYRRDEDDKLMILFLKPKSEAGKGYLRLDDNLFMYDPTTGKWERRTERERIGGTDSRRQDFDESRLAEEYTPEFVGTAKLGSYEAWHLKLEAKDDADVAYPVMELWVDLESLNPLKAQEFALSGRLMRTVYYPKWSKKYSESKGEEVYFPKQIRIFDEVEEGNQTTIVMRRVDLSSLETNMFTKAWLESKSR
ncbi:MAG: outer membrane lipoprotein-sorting protein [Myxococcota bacterium]